MVSRIDCVEYGVDWYDTVDDIYEQISGEVCDKLKRSLKLEHTEHNKG
jgi:hypothetical protein